MVPKIPKKHGIYLELSNKTSVDQNHHEKVCLTEFFSKVFVPKMISLITNEIIANQH